MSLLADAEQQQTLDELARMRVLVRNHAGDGDRADWLARIERLQGVLFWHLVDDSSARVRALEKQIAAAEALLADLDARVLRVQHAEDRFSVGVERDFHAFARRADVIAAQVDEALHGREEMLAAELRRGMQREMLEVEEYLLVARIAIARATDQLALGSGGERP